MHDLLQVEGDGPIKIGMTASNMAERLGAMRGMLPWPIRVLGIIDGVPKGTEAALHERFAQWRMNGEWFQPIPELIAHIDAEASPYIPGTNGRMRNTGMTRLVQYFRDDQVEWLRKESKRTGTSAAEIVRRAIDEFIAAVEIAGLAR
jgi:hypothetical protein